jgi:hypothetical protein
MQSQCKLYNIHVHDNAVKGDNVVDVVVMLDRKCVMQAHNSRPVGSM